MISLRDLEKTFSIRPFVTSRNAEIETDKKSWKCIKAQ